MTLFEPFALRGVALKNRVVALPMSQFRAQDGVANDWHLVQLGRFALGGAGLVFCEATAVQLAACFGCFSTPHGSRGGRVVRIPSVRAS